MRENSFIAPRTTMQHATARMLNRYMPWVDCMLTITFGKDDLHALPTYAQAAVQVRHLGTTLNSAVWSNRGKFDDKCRILYVPIIEGAQTRTRIHAHILLGNIRSQSTVEDHLRRYIPQSHWLAPRYDITSMYDADGLAWYVAKEAQMVPTDAIAWELASIPKPLLP